jgi:protein-ribulosamine 3-kinase
MHQKSVSATGKFGFHISTCYTKIAQAVDSWEGFWCVLYPKHLDHVMDVAKSILERPQFDMLCNFTLEKIVPGLLLPLQSEGRVLKPCLIHGDCGMEIQLWILELGRLLYSMSVLSTVIMNMIPGNWMVPRHRLSNAAYINSYKGCFPVSEPGEPVLYP